MCSTIVILAQWQSCQSVNELNRENQWAFFKIEGFAGKRSLLSPPPPPSFHHFALAPFFTRDPNDSFARPEFRSLRTGTLATQATPINVKLLGGGGGGKAGHRRGIWTHISFSVHMPSPRVVILGQKSANSSHQQWATKVVETVDWIEYYYCNISLIPFLIRFRLRTQPPSPFSMLYRKEANSRDRKSNIEKGGGGSIVKMRKENYIRSLVLSCFWALHHEFSMFYQG